MIIDIHNHLGEPAGTPYRQSADDLLRRMDRAGVDLAAVMPFPFNNYDNGYVAAAVHAHPDRLVGLFMASPFARGDVVEEMRRYVEEHGFLGVKLHPAAHGYKLSEQALTAPILEACEELGVPVLVYSGDEVYAVPFQLLVAARRHPNVQFIMAHSGFMMQTNDAILVARECANVCLEHSSAVSSGVSASVDAIGPERVLLGTDTPHMEFEVEIAKIRLTVPDQSAQRLILGANAGRLLKLPAASA